jgi:hypothetical protein
MANKEILEQMLEHLVNDEQQKAEELFHEYVVTKSREIYEGLIDSEIAEEEEKDEDEDEEMEEASSDEDAEEDKVDEEFEDIAIEADDDMDDMGGDPTDDLEGELGDDEDMSEKEPEELFQDLDSIVDELQAKFDAMKGGEEGDEEEMKDDFELETVREYVEKVPAGHGAEKKGAAEQADNKKSTIDNMKNDMGGTAANIAQSKEANEKNTGGLADIKAKEDNAGNINVPGGKAGSAFSKKEPGHGAEKKGSAESADNKQSLFRGRR